MLPPPEDWSSQVIPDGEFLFYRVPLKGLKPNNQMHPYVFKENEGAMSSDWERYSTPTITRNRAPKPQNFGVIKLIVDYIRARPGLSVIHSPDRELNNYSHTHVHGIEPLYEDGLPTGQKEEIQRYLFRMYPTWALEPIEDAPEPSAE